VVGQTRIGRYMYTINTHNTRTQYTRYTHSIHDTHALIRSIMCPISNNSHLVEARTLEAVSQTLKQKKRTRGGLVGILQAEAEAAPSRCHNANAGVKTTFTTALAILILFRTNPLDNHSLNYQDRRKLAVESTRRLTFHEAVATPRTRTTACQSCLSAD
jgi:hypothetical protein